jgi:hypothetical protein
LPPRSTARTPASGAGYRGSNPWGAANPFVLHFVEAPVSCDKRTFSQVSQSAFDCLKQKALTIDSDQANPRKIELPSRGSLILTRRLWNSFAWKNRSSFLAEPSIAIREAVDQCLEQLSA